MGEYKPAASQTEQSDTCRSSQSSSLAWSGRDRPFRGETLLVKLPDISFLRSQKLFATMVAMVASIGSFEVLCSQLVMHHHSLSTC